MLNKLYKFLIRTKIVKRKEEALAEVKLDIAFIENVKKAELECDEEDVRDELAKELNKPEKEKDYKKMKDLSRMVSESKETKAEYEKLLSMREELPRYIEIARHADIN